MSYISGARSVREKQVRIASTKMEGIGPKKAIQVRYRLGISGNNKLRCLGVEILAYTNAIKVCLSLYCGPNEYLWTRFSSLPLVRGVSFRKQILLFCLFRLFFSLLIYKIFLCLGLLLMDELSKALSPFYPSSGGVGSSGQPPLPSPSDPFSFHLPVSQDPEDNPPSLVHQQQDLTSAPRDVGKKKIEKVLEKHLKRHCQLVEVRTKYPQLNSTDVDFHYLAQNMAISQLDTDKQTDSEIADLAAFVGNYRKIKSLLEAFLASYYKEDD